MLNPVYVPVKLNTGESGHVCPFERGNYFKWWFVPDGKHPEYGYPIRQDDFKVIRSMQPEPKEYLRLSSVPYEIVYTSCYVNPPGQVHDGTQIGERADAAINLLVRYAEELEKRVKELEDDKF